MPAPRVLITPTPFAAVDQRPLEMLSALGVDCLVNPFGAKPTEEQMLDLVNDVDAIIAGTEPITDRVMANAPRLRLISRLGVGLDSVDLDAARRRSIAVSYTPAAPVPAVAEMTIGIMLVLLRSLHVSNARMHDGEWCKIIGRRVSEVTIGVVGVGPIGTMVLRYLSALGVSDVLLHDVNPDPCLADNVPGLAFEWVTLDRLLAESDVVTLHLPLTESTKNLVGFDELMSMKDDAVIINTSRGGILNEDNLYEVLARGHLSGAGIDVFEHEPYDGPLATVERCLLTSHMASASVDCRAQMEIEATEEVIRLLTDQPLQSLVPESMFPSRRAEGR